jgi:hypothetical protein
MTKVLRSLLRVVHKLKETNRMEILEKIMTAKHTFWEPYLTIVGNMQNSMTKNVK